MTHDEALAQIADGLAQLAIKVQVVATRVQDLVVLELPKIARQGEELRALQDRFSALEARIDRLLQRAENRADEVRLAVEGALAALAEAEQRAARTRDDAERWAANHQAGLVGLADQVRADVERNARLLADLAAAREPLEQLVAQHRDCKHRWSELRQVDKVARIRRSAEKCELCGLRRNAREEAL